MNTDCIMNSVDSSIKIEKNHFTFSGRIAVTGINKYSEIGNVSAVKMESVIQ